MGPAQVCPRFLTHLRHGAWFCSHSWPIAAAVKGCASSLAPALRLLWQLNLTALFHSPSPHQLGTLGFDPKPRTWGGVLALRGPMGSTEGWKLPGKQRMLHSKCQKEIHQEILAGLRGPCAFHCWRLGIPRKWNHGCGRFSNYSWASPSGHWQGKGLG